LRHIKLLFFFQAEDGIRDRNVTGVQTCALPICWPGDKAGIISESRGSGHKSGSKDHDTERGERDGGEISVQRKIKSYHLCPGRRSEERRVGKECRWWWGRDK